MCRRLLPRPDSHGLRKHVQRNEFASGFKLAITTEAARVIQAVLPYS
jgi:hypothetical protein